MATTFLKKPFSFGTHNKSYSRWRKWWFDFVFRKLCLESHFLGWKIIGHFVIIGQLPRFITCSILMSWRSSKFHDQFQDVFPNFYSLRNFKINLQGRVTRGNIIGNFGPPSLNKQFSSASKMHNSLIPNPNDVEFMT